MAAMHTGMLRTMLKTPDKSRVLDGLLMRGLCFALKPLKNVLSMRVNTV